MARRLIGTAQTLVCGDRSPIALPRREFLHGAVAAVASLAVHGIVPARAESAAAQPDYTLRITPLSLELAPAPVCCVYRKLAQSLSRSATRPISATSSIGTTSTCPWINALENTAWLLTRSSPVI
jgi:hypothetical protein